MAIPVSNGRPWPVLTLLVFWIGTPPAAGEDRPEFTYRANADEVRLNFSAMDRSNHGVATLQASDFAVVDKDVMSAIFKALPVRTGRN